MGITHDRITRFFLADPNDGNRRKFLADSLPSGGGLQNPTPEFNFLLEADDLGLLRRGPLACHPPNWVVAGSQGSSGSNSDPFTNP